MTTCPYCNKHIPDAVPIVCSEDVSAADPEQAQPEIDDVSLCVGCGYFSIYDHDLSLRRLTVGELEELSADPECARIHAAWVKLDHQRRHTI